MDLPFLPAICRPMGTRSPVQAWRQMSECALQRNKAREEKQVELLFGGDESFKASLFYFLLF